jgi:hypothetical protein
LRRKRMRIRRYSRGNGPRAGVAAPIRALTAAAVVSLLVVSAGCGSDDEARSDERPPVPINISINVDEEGITASPAEFGAGPITMLVANQSGASQTLTIDGPRLRRSVGPINPQDTATLRVRVEPGDYTVSAEESAGLREATLAVGPERPSAQNDLLLP